ncbi:MAG: GDSL-type esterase/lipase family protein [Chitinophagaceae bacterium]|jgi:lysophospholipase L1-like esterase|nr:GDSL-type esterase/lipase family protein [Chitinophagaceae bacterium]
MRKNFIYLLIVMLNLSFLQPTPKKVVFFGDSITEMGVKQGGYIWQMQQMLAQKGKAAQYELIGAGIGGNKVYDLYLRHETDVLAKKPDVVIIYVGVNDVWHKVTHQTGTDKDKFDRFYRALVAKFIQAGIRVILATPAGIGEKKDKGNPQDADLDAYSDIIRKIATDTGCRLVDLRALWQTHQQANNPANSAQGILTTDGVHLNETGNKAVAEAMLRALGE